MNDADAVWCDSCGARPGEQCVSVQNRTPVHKPHRQRVNRARRERETSPAPVWQSRTNSLRPSKRKTGRKRNNPGVKPSSVKAVKRRSGGMCEANIVGVCVPRAHDGTTRHHMIRRPHLPPADRDDPKYLLNACEAAHRWIHDQPERARSIGVLGRATDDPEDLQALREKARGPDGRLTL